MAIITHRTIYIKNKFKLLEEKNAIVSLLVDEIHLKLYFDYKKMSLQQVLLFLCLTMYSHSVVHIMTTKCLKAENLFDIVKHAIISLEEIDFISHNR